MTLLEIKKQTMALMEEIKAYTEIIDDEIPEEPEELEEESEETLELEEESEETPEVEEESEETPEVEQTEVTDDPDIEAKLNGVINAIQFELVQIKRISDKKTFTYVDSYEFELPADFYQVDRIECNYHIYGNKIVLDTDKTSIDMYYYKYPTVINDNTSDDFELELSLDCQIMMPYGVAADLLKGDPSELYKDYRDRYNEFKSQLRLSSSSPMIFADTKNAAIEF